MPYLARDLLAVKKMDDEQDSAAPRDLRAIRQHFIAHAAGRTAHQRFIA